MPTANLEAILRGLSLASQGAQTSRSIIDDRARLAFEREKAKALEEQRKETLRQQQDEFKFRQMQQKFLETQAQEEQSRTVADRQSVQQALSGLLGRIQAPGAIPLPGGQQGPQGLSPLLQQAGGDVEIARGLFAGGEDVLGRELVGRALETAAPVPLPPQQPSTLEQQFKLIESQLGADAGKKFLQGELPTTKPGAVEQEFSLIESRLGKEAGRKFLKSKLGDPDPVKPGAVEQQFNLIRSQLGKAAGKEFLEGKVESSKKKYGQDVERVAQAAYGKAAGSLTPQEFEEVDNLTEQRMLARFRERAGGQPIGGQAADVITNYNSMVGSLNRVKELATPEALGPIKGRAATIGQMLGSNTPETSELLQQLKIVSEIYARSQSGAAISASEHAGFAKQVPTINDQPNVFFQKLESFSKFIDKKAKGYAKIVQTSKQDAGSLIEKSIESPSLKSSRNRSDASKRLKEKEAKEAAKPNRDVGTMTFEDVSKIPVSEFSDEELRILDKRFP